MTLDTVKNAEQTPEAGQPWAELGLKEDEYARIREILGRRPTGAELAMFGHVVGALLVQELQGAPQAVR
jgi:phosphoribosylformylglycinamidine synthase